MIKVNYYFPFRYVIIIRSLMGNFVNALLNKQNYANAKVL